MSTNIQELDPKIVWDYFYQITQIPHPSKHEEKIKEFLIATAKKLNLKYKVTPIGNIIIQKNATAGMESHKKVTLQAHMDMVGAKSTSSSHDFLTDPLSIYIDNGWVRATQTTLGADNGIGMAYGLAVLASSDIKHGPLELLITVDEEIGMSGAFALEATDISGDILLNLDSEEDEEVCIGCAGGIDSFINIPITLSSSDPLKQCAYKITLDKVLSGHSGIDIHLGRINTIKDIFSLLYVLTKEIASFNLCHISGGKLRNVIPSYCEAVIAIDKEDQEQLLKIITNYKNDLIQEYQLVELTAQLLCSPIALPELYIEKNIAHQIILAGNAVYNGLYHMNWKLKIPQTSTNFGVIRTLDDKIAIIFLSRSPENSAKIKLANKVSSPFELIGATVIHNGNYPGWIPNLSSEMLKIVIDCYQELFGSTIKISATHGGLECGIILARKPEMDAVSIGATIRDPHSSNERVNIASVAKIWKLLVTILECVPPLNR